MWKAEEIEYTAEGYSLKDYPNRSIFSKDKNWVCSCPCRKQMTHLKCRFSLFFSRLVRNFYHPLQPTEQTRPTKYGSHSQPNRGYLEFKIQNKDNTERNGTKLSEMITSGTPFTLFPILITHSKNPPKRETNNKSALAPKQTLCLLLY